MRILFLLAALLVFGMVNLGVYRHETLLKEGKTVYLKLAPVDPRSLMQGDYMRLRYELETQIPRESIPKQRSGKIIIDCTEQCTFVDFYGNQSLASNQYVMNARFLSYSVHIKPDTFLFQEGLAELYANAKFGVFVFDDNQRYLLAHLADEHKKIIRPENNH